MIVTIIIAYAGVIGLSVHIGSGGSQLAMVAYVMLLVLLCGALLHSVRRLEAVERLGKLFDRAFEELTKGIPANSDELGPKSIAASNLSQDGQRKIKDYIDEAKRLFPRLTTEVLDVLSKAIDPGGEAVKVMSNLKGIERVKEKTRLDYKGNASKVRDYMRACFIAFTMPEIRRACDAVVELERQGVVEVLQIKNRFRYVRITLLLLAPCSCCRRRRSGRRCRRHRRHAATP